MRDYLVQPTKKNMKVTNINARKDRSGKHNDRNFNLDNASHIDQNRITDNLYWTYNGDTSHTFNEIEEEFYRTHFLEHIKEQSARNKAIGHSERNQTIEEYHRSKFTRPEDKILQIGNIKEHASKEELWECAQEYRLRFDSIYGERCKILDMALHMDEATPHVHVRRVWIAEDENGNECVGQNKSLKMLGVKEPDTTKPCSKYNNPKITFTQTDIELFKTVCIEKNIQVDRTPPERRKQLSVIEYKKKQILNEVEELERKKEILDSKIENLEKIEEHIEKSISLYNEFLNGNYFNGLYEAELEQIKKKSIYEQYHQLSKLYEKELYALIESEDIEAMVAKEMASNEFERIEKFLKNEGLIDKYAQWKKETKEKQTVMDII